MYKNFNEKIFFNKLISPEEFIPFILLGIGTAYFEANDLEKAVETFDRIIKSHYHSKASPEAIYYNDVSSYKKSHDPKHLKLAYEELKKNFPENDWTGRAEPYKFSFERKKPCK